MNIHVKRAARLAGGAAIALSTFGCATGQVAHQSLAAVPAAHELSHGNEAEPIEADRPGFSEGAGVVEPGRFQTEAGYGYERAGDERAHEVGQLLLRAGIPSGLPIGTEIRLDAGSYNSRTASGATVSGRGDMAAGIKAHVARGAIGSLRPDVGVVLQTTLPTGHGELGSHGYDPEVKLIAGWRPVEGVELTTNTSYASVTHLGHRVREWSGVAELGYAITHAVHGFGEYYVRRQLGADGERQRWVNGGLTWRATSDLQLDVSAGREIGHGVAPSRAVFGVGIARRW